MNKEKLITIFENILEEYSPNTEPLSLEGEYEIEYIQVESLMNYINNLKQENKELHNKIDKLEDELEWYKQECDDLEMSGGVHE